MRILQVCPYDWHAPGGVQTHVRQLALELRRRGHDVCVIAPGDHPADDDWVRIVGRPIRVPFNGSRAPVCLSPLAGWRIWRLITAFAPDLVHAHEPFAPSVSLMAGLLTTAPLVATFHAHCDMRIGPWLYAIGTWPLNRCVAAGIGVSPAAVRCLSRRVRVPFRIVPNGVDPAFFALASARQDRRPRRVLFAHRLEPRKGFGVALAAFERLAATMPDIELIVVGDGEERGSVDAIDPAARARVRMRGTLSRADLAEAFATATVFVAPATSGESFGVVLLEAMAAALPIAASDVDGYRQVLAGGGATLVPAGDANALAEAIARLLESPELARSVAEAGRANAARYGWDRITDDVEEVYGAAAASMNSARARAAI